MSPKAPVILENRFIDEAHVLCRCWFCWFVCLLLIPFSDDFDCVRGGGWVIMVIVLVVV